MTSLSRRSFLIGGVGAVSLATMPQVLRADPLPTGEAAGPPPASDPLPDMTDDEKRFQAEAKKAVRARDPRTEGFGSLQLYRQANGDSMVVKYRTEEGYYRDALAELSWFWRDVADADLAVWIDPALLDFVSSVQSTMAAIHGSMLPFVLTIGYRTPRRNETIEGAARNSQHLYGRARDFKVPMYPARSIGIAGLAFKGGGVGFYQSFTHLDVGELRCWPRGCNNMVAYNGR